MKEAEIIRLPVGIPGVGRAGDNIVSDPDHPDERYRLTAVRSLDAYTLPALKERLLEEQRLKDAAPRKEVTS